MYKKIFLTAFLTVMISVGLSSLQSVKADTTPTALDSQKEKPVTQEERSILELENESKVQIEEVSTDYGSTYFTQVSFTDIVGNSLAKVNDSDKIKVNYNFSIPEDVHAKETMSIQLPEQLQMVNYNGFPIVDDSGTVIANASIDKATGLMTLSFTNNVENKTDITGSLFFWVKFDKDKLSDGENHFSMPLQGVTQDLTLNVHKTVNTGLGTVNPTVIFKSGSFDKNDPSLINWTITVNNAHQNLLQPKIIDTIGPGQSLVPGTFSFNYRDENKKSMKKFTLPSGAEAAEGRTKAIITPTGFELNLENLGSYSINNHYSSAVITYQTKVDAPTVRYVNNAGTLDELDQPQQRNASVIDYGSGGVASGNTQEAIDQLNNTIDAATSLDTAVLAPEAEENLFAAITTAQNVVDNETATKEQLDEASTQLGQIVDEVTPSDTPPIDNELTQALENLNDLIEEAKLKDSSLYTDTSWQVVEEAMNEAASLLANEKEHPGTTPLQSVQNSVTKLRDALNALVTKAQEQLENERAVLQNLVNEAESKNEVLYTEESWTTLISAKEKAKKILATDKSEITLKEVKKQQQELYNALINLKEKITSLKNTSNLDNNTSTLRNPPRKNLPATGEKSNHFYVLTGMSLLLILFMLIGRIHLSRRSHF